MIRKYETMWDEGELPTYESVNHCQLLAERDLWETRYRMDKGALRTAAYIDHPMGTEIRNKWAWAVNAIERKLNEVKSALEWHENMNQSEDS